jgi:hypothetical protein
MLIAVFFPSNPHNNLALLVSSGLSRVFDELHEIRQTRADGDNQRSTVMTSLRKQDRSDRVIPHRTERVFDIGGLWYFRTREGSNIGPFRYQSEARQMIEKFITDIVAAETRAARASKPHSRLLAGGRYATGTFESPGFSG